MKQIYRRGIRLFFSLKVLLCTTVVVALVTGCFSYKQVKHVIRGKKSLVYQINTTGVTSQTALFLPKDLVRELGGKAGSSITIINRFQLESMDIEVEPNPANTGNSFRLLSLLVKSFNLSSSGSELLNRQDKLIPLNKASTFIANAYLLTDGVDEINKLITSSIAGRSPLDFFQAIEFRLTGENVPLNSRVSIKLTINLNATIEYTQCEQVIDLFSEGDDYPCD